MILLASCGGPSREDFIQRADAICAGANDRFRAVGPLPNIDITYAGPAQMPVAAAYLDRAVPIFRAESSQLHGLGDPAEDASSVHDMLGFFDGFVDRLEDARRAAHRGDAQTFTPTLLRGLGDGVQAQNAAPAFGFKVCGRLPPLRG